MRRTFLVLALVSVVGWGCTGDPAPVPPGMAMDPIVDGERWSGDSEVVFLYNLAGSACTATIIAPRVVLTAKHCAASGGPSQFQIFTGPSTSNLTGMYRVSEVRRAPGAGAGSDDSDVAILILSTPARETPREVSFDSPISLVDRNFTAIGYGQIPSGSSGTKYKTTKRVQGIMGGYIFVEPAVCEGDSGGPLIGFDDKVWGVASFFYSPDGGRPRCGTAPGAYNSVRRWQDMIETAIMDSGSCVPHDEVCNGADDNCDGTVDEGCTALGEPCTASDECVGNLCADTPIGRVCTQACDPLRPSLGCPLDLFCARSAARACDGVCIPGGAGMLGVGEPCSGDTDCASLYCADPGDGTQRCLAPCQGDAGMCLAGEVCAAPAGSCSGCVSEDLVLGDRGLGEACDDASSCTSGMCFDDEGVTYCTRTCMEDADCGSDAFHCRGTTCVRGPREGIGGGCVANEDCGGGLACARRGDTRWCTQTCDMDCPMGFSCNAEAHVCEPALGLVGEGCAANEDCISGLCAGTPAGQICTRFCGPDNQCSPGFECRRFGDGTDAVCIPASTGGGGGGGGGGCSAAGSRGGAGGGFLLSLVALAVIARRRRRSG